MTTLEEFVKQGGRLEFGNPDHIKMVRDAELKNFPHIEWEEKYEIKAKCPHCGNESDWYEDNSDRAADEISEYVDQPKGLEYSSLDSKEFAKCDHCKKIFTV